MYPSCIGRATRAPTLCRWPLKDLPETMYGTMPPLRWVDQARANSTQVMTREILATCVAAPLLDLFNPGFLNRVRIPEPLSSSQPVARGFLQESHGELNQPRSCQSALHNSSARVVEIGEKLEDLWRRPWRRLLTKARSVHANFGCLHAHFLSVGPCLALVASR